MKKATHNTGNTGWILVLTHFLMFQVTSACSVGVMGSNGGGTSPPPISEGTKEGISTIRMIHNDPEKFGNKEVVLKGVFRGWEGKCEESKPFTRSDWILEDQTGCIYVSGKIPSWVSTLEPKGESLVVSGVVIIMGGGKPNFAAKEIFRK